MTTNDDANRRTNTAKHCQSSLYFVKSHDDIYFFYRFCPRQIQHLCRINCITTWVKYDIDAQYVQRIISPFTCRKNNSFKIYIHVGICGEFAMGLLPDTQNRGCACAGNAGNVFPVTAGKRSRHASRHVRHARAVMHAGIAN